jgi:hypothetical protein
LLKKIVQGQHVPQVIDVFVRQQFRHASRGHQDKHGQPEAAVFAQDIVGFAAHDDEILKQRVCLVPEHSIFKKNK